MRPGLVPRRRYGRERLDEPGVDPRVRVRSLQDVARSNVLFGGRRAVVGAVVRALPDIGAAGTLLDVGCGLGDIAAAARDAARQHDIRLTVLGLDLAEELARASRDRGISAACGDAFHLPFADHSVDLVTCSQMLHHFPEAEVRALVRELDRVARRRVIVGDLRRSWAAASGFWLASFPLGFHPVTRHDGTLSVLRGFTAGELRGLVAEALGVVPTVHRHAGWRLSATWSPAEATP